MRWLFLMFLAGCGARTDLWLEAVEPCVPTSDVELCDGLDNDCNGAVDEGIEPIRCGEHGCETVVRCVDGVMPACVPRTPGPEECNFIDDDCDGEIDEGLGFGPQGEVTLLRSDEYNTGDCTSCSWAFDTTLAPVGDGFLALWNIGLYGGREQPTLYGRLVDGAGRLAGEIELLREDYILHMHPMRALLPLPGRGLPLDAVYRIGHDDDAGFLFVNSDGETEVEVPTPAFGPRNRPLSVWTGERIVSAWEVDRGLEVVSLAADGGDVRHIEVDNLERVGAITLGLFPGRVGILVARYEMEPVEIREQWFILLDAQGEVVLPARRVDVEYTTWQYLVGTEEGWLYVHPESWDEQSTRQLLDVDGDPVTERWPFADGRRISQSGARFALRPVTNEIVLAWQPPAGGDMYVEILDSAGDTLRGWSGPLDPDPGYEAGYMADPHIVFSDDRILVIWHGISPDASPNPVYMRAFGCVP